MYQFDGANPAIEEVRNGVDGLGRGKGLMKKRMNIFLFLSYRFKVTEVG